MRTAPELRTWVLRDTDVTDNLRRMRGLAVPYDQWTDVGWYHERIQRGAADKSCREAARGLPLLLWHDNRTWPIGRSTGWTLDDPAGLVGEWEFDDSDDAQRAARQARDRMMTGLSIGFQPIQSERVFADEDDWDGRVPRDAGMGLQVTRTEIRLLETSLTPTPAYAGAQVEHVRSLTRTAEQRPEGRAGGGMSAATRRAIDAARAQTAAFNG